MSKGTKNKLYRYIDSGLDYIFLANGFNVIKDPEFGTAVSIHNVDALNNVIAKTIVDKIPYIRGQELRFMRSILKLSQTEMGVLLARDLRTIQRWEEKRNDPIDPTADKFLRLFYSACGNGKEAADRACGYLKMAKVKEDPKQKKANNIFVPRVELKDKNGRWLAAA